MSKPKIYLFINGRMEGGDVIGKSLAEDGTILSGHFSSNEDFSKHDMGLTSDWKHEYYKKHYPNGYELEWVDHGEDHRGFQAAIKSYEERREKSKQKK